VITALNAHTSIRTSRNIRFQIVAVANFKRKRLKPPAKVEEIRKRLKTNQLTKFIEARFNNDICKLIYILMHFFL
jgi:hypothetical protein